MFEKIGIWKFNGIGGRERELIRGLLRQGEEIRTLILGFFLLGRGGYVYDLLTTAVFKGLSLP